MRDMLICVLVFLALLGCDKDKAEDAARDGIARLSKAYEESKMLAHVDRFIAAVDARDMECLKRLCHEDGDANYTAIMGCYYRAFALENEQGVDAARQYLAEEAAKEDNPPAKDKALQVLREYFETKGTLRTREVAGIILIVALEAKYPHRGGVIGGIIAERLGLMDLRRSASQPTGPRTRSAPAPRD